MTPRTDAARAIVARLEMDARVFAREVDDLTRDIRDDDTPDTTRREMEEHRELATARAGVIRDLLTWLPRELVVVELEMVGECERMDAVLA